MTAPQRHVSTAQTRDGLGRPSFFDDGVEGGATGITRLLNGDQEQFTAARQRWRFRSCRPSRRVAARRADRGAEGLFDGDDPGRKIDLEPIIPQHARAD
jgi:hypothetical protein